MGDGLRRPDPGCWEDGVAQSGRGGAWGCLRDLLPGEGAASSCFKASLKQESVWLWLSHLISTCG